MSLQRYTQPRKTFSIYVPKKPLSIILQKKNQTMLPLLVIPSVKAEKITKKFSYNANIKSLTAPIVDNELSKSIQISASNRITDNEIFINNIDPIPSSKSGNFNRIFEEKIKICNIIFNFSNSQIQIRGKKVKNDSLVELNELLSNNYEVYNLTDSQKVKLFEMIKINIFEQDPYIAYKKNYLSTIKWDFIETSWPHLNLVYQLLIRYIQLFPERCKTDLVYQSIRLLNIPDLKEREMLMTILSIYANDHPDQLNEIWRLVQNALLSVISNVYTPYCVEPLISFINNSIDINIISESLRSHFLPLFKHEQLFLFSVPLTNLIVNIIDERVIEQLDSIEFLIKHFPYQCGRKQFLFINAISSIVNVMLDLDMNQISRKLIFFLGTTLKTPNTKLIDVSARIILKPSMASILLKNSEYSIENLYESLSYLSVSCWDNNVKIICKKALTTLNNISYEAKKNAAASCSVNTTRLPVMSKKCQGELIQNDASKTQNSELVGKWALVARCASRKDESIDLTKSLLHIQASLLNEEKSMPQCSRQRRNSLK